MSFDCHHGLLITHNSCRATIGANALLGRTKMAVVKNAASIGVVCRNDNKQVDDENEFHS